MLRPIPLGLRNDSFESMLSNRRMGLQNDKYFDASAIQQEKVYPEKYDLTANQIRKILEGFKDDVK